MASSSSARDDPASIHPGLKSLDYLNPKIGSIYYRMNQDEILCYSTPEAFLLWKALPSTQAAVENRPFFVFLHDYGSSARVFDQVVADMPFFCLAIDFRGWGRSDDTKDKSHHAYSVRNMKEQIPRVVNLLQGEKFILVGHGMGAKVAQLYAAQHPPSNLVGIVLLAPVPLSAWRPSADIMKQYRAAYKPGGNLEEFSAKTLMNNLISNDDFRDFIEDGQKDTPLAKDAWLSYGMDEDYSHSIARIEVATAIVTGAEDKIISALQVHHKVTSKLKLSLGFVAEKCGHLIPLEDDGLVEILTAFAVIVEDFTSGRFVDWIKIGWEPWEHGPPAA